MQLRYAARMAIDPELEYLEKLFGDAYRKEIDQEENVWRSLPFFAATLALQLAGLAQIRDWVGDAQGWLFWVALTFLLLAALATLAALVFLAQSIWPARFRYATSEPELQDYVERVRATAIASGSSQDEATLTAVAAARTVMVQQYAVSASNNRLLNQGRANRRTRAGLATLASVFAVLVLVAFVVVSRLHGHEQPSNAVRQSGAGQPGAVQPGPAADQSGDAAAGRGGVQGLVERPHDPPASGRPRAGRP